MSLTTIWSDISTHISNLGYVTFAVLVIIDIVLWKVHPVLGTIGALIIFALITGLI